MLVAANRQPVRKLEDLRDAARLSRGRLLLKLFLEACRAGADLFIGDGLIWEFVGEALDYWGLGDSFRGFY